MSSNTQRQIVLDTETTGLEHKQGDRVIEIGCIELIQRKLTGNNYHIYLNPQREVAAQAIEVHGITNEFLQDKPLFDEIADKFIHYISGAELIIHNASFDVGFLDAEFARQKKSTKIKEICSVVDTLTMARKRFPGQRNNLDALCKRFQVNNTQRDLHGALLDAEILADVYLRMTGGQIDLQLQENNNNPQHQTSGRDFSTLSLPTIAPEEQELKAHNQWIQHLDEKVQGSCVWRKTKK